MRRTVTLRYPATCAECGAELAAGDRARYYGPYRVYGIGCHARTEPKARPRTSKVEQRAARELHASQDAWDRTMHPERAARLEATKREAAAEDIALEDNLSTPSRDGFQFSG